MIHEFTQLIWLETPKGLARAIALIDYGVESDLYWVCAINETGECWTFENSEIKFNWNATIGRRQKIDVVKEMLR